MIYDVVENAVAEFDMIWFTYLWYFPIKLWYFPICNVLVYRIVIDKNNSVPSNNLHAFNNEERNIKHKTYVNSIQTGNSIAVKHHKHNKHFKQNRMWREWNYICTRMRVEENTKIGCQSKMVGVHQSRAQNVYHRVCIIFIMLRWNKQITLTRNKLCE